MADYRFYRLAGGHIVSAEVHDCSDDAAARAHASGLLATPTPPCEGVEFWLLTRLVGTVTRSERGGA